MAYLRKDAADGVISILSFEFDVTLTMRRYRNREDGADLDDFNGAEAHNLSEIHDEEGERD
jgi:hypothetical protein